MKRKTPVPGSRGLKIAIFFVILLLLLIGGALLIKGILLVARSKFDGAHQFVLLEKSRENKSNFLIFNPDTKSITSLTFPNVSSDKVTRQLLVASDGQIEVETVQPVKSLLQSLLMHFSSFHPTMTIIDGIRLLLFSLSVPQSNITTKQIIVSPDDPQLQKTLSSLFVDTSIYKENASVSVVNASGVSGLGTTVAEFATHMGANVVSVTTAEKEEDMSFVAYASGPTYTARRLAQILHFPLKKQTLPGLADVIILLGKKESGNF